MTNRTCSEEACERPLWARGKCSSHYSSDYKKARPQWAADQVKAAYHDVQCVQCGKQYRSARKTGKLCSDQCRGDWQRGRTRVSKLPLDHPVRQRIREAATSSARSPLRVAVEAGDHAGIIAAIRLHVIEAPGGCWIWQRRLRDGYPEVRVAGKTFAVHRLVLEAKHRAPLGKQAAHHTCATPACVAPHHLQPVTARENSAEMLARTYLESRIHDLETALRDYAPDHPLLAEIGIIAA